MADLTAQNNFRRGLAAMVDDNFSDAVVFFQRAMELERQLGTRSPEMRYLSYYGLCLARARHSLNESLDACLEAVRREAEDPDLYLNLGLVYLMAGNRSDALSALERGLLAAPYHPILLRELRRLERRSTPVISRLARAHPLNRSLGRVRAAFSRWNAGGDAMRAEAKTV